MPTLKASCPECNATCRYSVEAVDEPTSVNVTCLKCGHEFYADAAPPEAPAPTKKAKPEKAAEKPTKKATKARPASRDDDDDEDKPRKKKRKHDEDDEDDEETPSNKKLIIGIVAGVLVLGGVIGAVIAFTGKDKKDTAQTTPPPANTNPGGLQVAPGPNPGPNTGPNGVPLKNPNPSKQPDPKQPDPKQPDPKQPKEPKEDDLPPGSKLPAPPVIRISGSLVPKDDGPVIARLPAVPPLAPDEDPFVRAVGFRPDGPLPPMPKLPPVSARPLLTLDSGGHTGFVKSVFITPKGDRVVSVSEDKAVRIWDSAKGDPIHTIRLPAGPADEGSLQAAALSPNGKRLAVAGIPLKNVKDGAIPVFLINVETGTFLKTLSTAASVVMALDFSVDGNRLAVGCADGTLQVFDVNSAARIANVDAHAGGIREVRYNPNPKTTQLASIGTDSTVKIWNVTGKTPPVVVSNPSFQPSCLDWTSDGRTLAVGGRAGAIAMFSLEGNVLRTHPPRIYEGAPEGVYRLHFLKGDKEIACCGGRRGGGWAGVIDADTGAMKVKFSSHTNVVVSLNVSADGTRVVSSGGNQHETYVWDATDGKVISRLCGLGNGIWGVGWAKDGKSIAFGTENITGENDTRSLSFTFRLDDFGVGNVIDQSRYDQANRSDDVYALQRRAGSNEYALVTLTTAEGVRFALPGGEKIYSACIIPKRRMAVIGGAFSQVLVDPSDGRVIRSFTGHTGNILAVAASPDGKYFVTGSSDQTIRIWLPEYEEPFLSIFIAGRDWIAWTPQGFYACSPNGERLIAWQVNATGNLAAYRFPQVHPAARFRPSMYQPAIVKYLIPAGSLPMALAMAKKFDQALVQTTSVADAVPPEVTLESPAPLAGKEDAGPPLIIDKETFTVKATAKGSAKQPITAMRLLVDGRPFGGAAGVKRFDKPDVNAEATWEVPLTPGPHSFAVIADSPLSKGMSRVGTLTRSGEIPKPNLYVLAVGVSAYPGDMKLRFAASDAILLAGAFQEKSKGVFGTIEVKVLTDADATKKGIQTGLDWLQSKMTPKDVGIFSFSGHGTRDPFGKFFLVPVDIKDDDPFGTCFSGDEFKTRLENMPGRLVAILDACHSGSVAEKIRPPAQADGLVRDLVSEDAGVIVMCASMGREYSYENPLCKAGNFTFGLVEGMSGHGDIDQDGVVYINELEIYASARARQLSKGRQNPTLGRPPSIRAFAIAKPEKN